jgi:hypothetical protein
MEIIIKWSSLEAALKYGHISRKSDENKNEWHEVVHHTNIEHAQTLN